MAADRRREVLLYIDEIKGFMVKHGFTEKEAEKETGHWREDCDELLFHQPVEYWYYNAIRCEEDFFRYHFHSRRLENEEHFLHPEEEFGADIAGCLACAAIFPPAEVKKFLCLKPEDGEFQPQGTALCPRCDRAYVVPWRLRGRQRKQENEAWFATQIQRAQKFWFLERKYDLV